MTAPLSGVVVFAFPCDGWKWFLAKEIVLCLSVLSSTLVYSTPRRDVPQLLQGLALVEEDMCSQSLVPAAGLIENSSISRVNVEGSLKSLKLARSKVDVLLQQVVYVFDNLKSVLFRLHYSHCFFSLQPVWWFSNSLCCLIDVLRMKRILL